MAPTGLARVAEALLRRLGDAFDIAQLGSNYDGDPHSLPWPVYQARRERDIHGTRRLGPLIAKLKPDLVWIINDLDVVALYLDALGDARPLPPIVAYCPLEAGPVDPALLDRLAGLTRLVLYTEFAKAAVEAARARRARRQGGTVPFPALEVVPHGIDTAAFHPISGTVDRPVPDRPRARAAVWPQRPELQDAFIVLNANRNQPRKQIDVTLRGFALFARDKPPSVQLCLHMGRKDLGWDIPTLAGHLGLGPRLIFDGRWLGTPRLDDATLNRLYNACDVGLNTANAEGWGLVAFEHAATGAAQVVPGFSAPGEIWRGAAELLEPSVTLHHPALSFEEKIIAPETVAAALERLYRDPELRAERARQAYAVATDPRYAWNTLAARWRRVLGETLAAVSRHSVDHSPEPEVRREP
ncbi:hypothetical protein KXS07_37130 [Inquilinus limosus]|uniref:glycosyltransferase family protein n=1 Tax=Inquilinus limosus TaxID=171674 RepID=UPI003F178315